MLDANNCKKKRNFLKIRIGCIVQPINEYVYLPYYYSNKTELNACPQFTRKNILPQLKILVMTLIVKLCLTLVKAKRTHDPIRLNTCKTIKHGLELGKLGN